jgi:hypothetical protein
MNKPMRWKRIAARTLPAAIVVCAFASGCAVAPKAIDDLPELPAEFAKDLAVAAAAPVLMTRPVSVATPIVPAPAPLPLAPAKACTSVYEGYVLYPMTVCYPPNVLTGDLVLTQDAREAPPRAVGAGVLPAKYFKLSSHPAARIGLPWFCTVRSGPWFGHVEGAQICNANPNIRAFKAEILGAPQPVLVIWSGALSDVPPPLNLLSIPQVGEFCVCCSGTMCPDGRCVLNPNQCSIGPPAAK